MENLIYENFAKPLLDNDGKLKGMDFFNTGNFNFAFDVVDALAEKQPDKLALMYVGDDFSEKRLTFSDISRFSSMAANYFLSLGIKRGDKVMLVLKRPYQFWFILNALHKIGAVAIPATNLLVEHDFTYRFKAASVSTIICTADGHTIEHAEKAASDCDCVKTKIVVNGSRSGWENFDENFSKFSDRFERTPDSPGGNDNMLMFFTSGTTSYPKIATHTYLYPLGHIVTAKFWHNVKKYGLHFTISDTGWAKSMWGKIYGQWLCEAAVFVYDFEKFDAGNILPMFAKYHITTFCAPPTMYRFFIKEDLSKYDLSSIEYATVAGEALNPEVFYQFKKATGLEVMEGFGQTETTLIIANLVGDTIKLGSMGKPLPTYDVRLMLPDGSFAKPGETGEIVIMTDKTRPYGLFSGYYLENELTRKTWHDGAYHTGDTATCDEDGYFWYVGRVDDVIKSSGYRIGPFEIESVIMELPYVLECAITAVPDEIRGQIVKATIVLVKGKQPSEELKKEVQQYVKTHTAPYKYPRIVEFVDELPKTISGKIRRAEIRENDLAKNRNN